MADEQAHESARACRVCGIDHRHRDVLESETEVTLTMDAATAKRLLASACWANEWSVVDAIRHALTSGDATTVDERI